jgi:hypothetical protein
LAAFSAAFALAAAALYAFSGWATAQGAELLVEASAEAVAAFFSFGGSLIVAVATAVLGAALIGLGVIAKQMAANFAIAAADAWLLSSMLMWTAASGGLLTKRGLGTVKWFAQWFNTVALSWAGYYVNLQGKGLFKFIQGGVQAVIAGGWALGVAPSIALGAIQDAENALG